MNMPMYAAIISFPLALIPGVNSLVVGEDTVFGGNIIAALVTAGHASVVCIMLVLGT